MVTYEVVYETTLPPWHIGHESIEAENQADLKKKFRTNHEAAHMMQYSEKKLEGSSN